jgi:hypothetical protein
MQSAFKEWEIEPKTSIAGRLLRHKNYLDDVSGPARRAEQPGTDLLVLTLFPVDQSGWFIPGEVG